MSKKNWTSSLTDETYYRMSQRAYNYDYLKRKLEKNDYIRINSSISKTTHWYVDQIKSDDNTGLDAVVLVQAVKKNGKWVKSKNPENVVVAFAGTDITNGPIFDCGNIVFGNDPKKEVYYFVKEDTEDTSNGRNLQ
ncbi:hypothetical protein BAJT_16260 [Bacillus velezensis]|nr:hypothetical protein BCBMB205_33270 [Bacillus velezensis]APQ51250.1 hypothetical protein BSO20_15140 [Bacillus amyloliquefaciens]ARM29289.1 hypothetical protein B9C48_16265 [Bacillus vallismortis]ANS39783.1 hypothetical protein A5891_15885 [Bacillus velezensis]ANU31541.1 hypothetical protein A8142_15755 [Bacillus velezensis]